MQLTNQSTWWGQFRKDLRELATMRVRAMRGSALTAAQRDGSGVRGVRQGCYTLGDVLALVDVAPWDAPAAYRRRLEELEPEVLPLSRRDCGEIKSMFGHAGSVTPPTVKPPDNSGFAQKARPA